jgi:hypothetical protein
VRACPDNSYRDPIALPVRSACLPGSLNKTESRANFLLSPASLASLTERRLQVSAGRNWTSLRRTCLPAWLLSAASLFAAQHLLVGSGDFHNVRLMVAQQRGVVDHVETCSGVNDEALLATGHSLEGCWCDGSPGKFGLEALMFPRVLSELRWWWFFLYHPLGFRTPYSKSRL